jgi:hypothetical protein
VRPPTPLERGAEKRGTPLLATAVASALDRLRRSGRSAESILKDRHFFDERETALVAAAIYDVRVLADLAGRQKALRQVDLAREQALQARVAQARRTTPWLLADDPEDPLGEDAIWKMQPEKAIRYFEDLRPGKQLSNDWSTGHRRQAFEMAVTSDQTLLDRVHGLIERGLKEGTGYSYKFDIELDDLGIGHENPGYQEMLWRTNVMDAYTTGSWDAVADDPDLAEEFPFWEYLAVEDDRIRDGHAANLTGGINGTAYYPASQTFEEVRGTDISDVANCRCDLRWIHKFEAADLGLPVAKGNEET